MMVIITMVKSTEKDDLNGAMGAYSQVPSITIISKARASTNGTTVGATKETGKITKWMDLAYLRGLTEENMKANINQI